MLKKWMSVCSALALSMVLAQGAAAASPVDDAQAVAAAVEKMGVAMNHPADGPTLGQLVMDDLSYGHSNGKVQNKAEFIDALVSGASNLTDIIQSDQTIKVVQDVAVVRNTFLAVTNDAGKTGKVSLKILMVWKKLDGQWRLLARQAVRSAA
ncbi:nuclear transport factor 2 family protein [Collimonas sp. NPDC087041]|uniref:nuclear transport factor 2 family protein n=1 Tax=Collimonas sp. NPDC087041 TaxID=3363960 RepID=UPI0037F759A3